MRNFGLKVFSLVTIFMILIQNSSSTVADSSGDEQLETMVEEDENELAYSSRTHGYIPNKTFFFFFLLLRVSRFIKHLIIPLDVCSSFSYRP